MEGYIMNKKLLFPIFCLFLIVVSLLVINGCGSAATSGGSSGGNRSGTYSYSGTQAPGDVWTWTISTETFSGSNETTGFWITGEWTTLTTGFGKAHIKNSNDSGAINEYAYFLEFPNTALIVKPANSDDDNRVMICAASATIEPDQGIYLYVHIPEDGWSLGSPAYGTVEAQEQGGVGTKWQFNTVDRLLSGEVGSVNVSGYHFILTNGSFTNEQGSGVDPTKIFMTPSSMFTGDSGPGRGGLVGAPYMAITTTEMNSTIMSHTFKGVRFIYYPAGPGSSTGETEPITCHKHSTLPNTLWASSYSNVETGTIPGLGVEITFEAQQQSGFIKGYVLDEHDLHTETLRTVVSKIGPAGNQKYCLFGFGFDFSKNVPFNFLLIQVD
jgi:hypothetical protein